MIKCETLGMFDVAKINPVLTSDEDVTNYSFITVDDVLYLVMNTFSGDASYREDMVIKAGEYLNGFDVEAWKDKKLVIDGKHVTGGIDSLSEGDVLVAADDGTLEAGEASGVHFVVTDVDAYLTEAAIKARVAVA
ncbi:MAG: hypothetical protein LUC91_00805 [Prevotella sp.]|nr:hypothetical protein [Prevotella sp.]